MRKIIPLLLALLGLAGGGGVGLFLRPDASSEDHADPEADAGHGAADTSETGDHDAEAAAEDHGDQPAEDHGAETGPEYVKLSNQFVVPVVREGRVDAMVVLAISLEVEPGNTDGVFQREPKLRDAFLQVMFDHANVGGFNGSFTDSSNLIVLRTNLKEAAAMILGTVVRDVLITEIARQDS